MARSFPNREYTIAWICPLPVERTAGEVILDELHEGPYEKHVDDHNSYTLGSIGKHKIVLASLPIGCYANNNAIVVAKDVKLTFPSINIYLLVGVGGGVPSDTLDIRLGDVVVSKPDGVHGGVVQYDRGKTVAGGQFQRSGSLNKPLEELLTAIAGLEALRGRERSKIPDYIAEAYVNHPDLNKDFRYQGQENDMLYNADYNHEGNPSDCTSCKPSELKFRELRGNINPSIYYGTIASGNRVIKDGATRDKKAREIGAICFEMEAAGIMDHFPCLVVRGICDYCDSHKNKRWQPYAALTAAAYTKELLNKLLPRGPISNVPPVDVEQRIFDVPRILHRHFSGRQQYLRDIHNLILSTSSASRGACISVWGMPGLGKTQLCLKYAEDYGDNYKYVFYAIASTEGQWLGSCDNIVRSLNLPEADSNDQNIKIQGLKRWLSANRSWLLIIDDITKSAVDALRNTLPLRMGGNILSSTRDIHIAQDFSTPEFTIALREMDSTEGKELVLKILNRQEDGASGQLAEKISEKLGGLPLALEQGTSFGAQCHWDLDKLLDRLQENKHAIINDPLRSGQHVSLVTTLSMAVGGLEPAHVAILNLILMLRPQALPLSLLSDGAHKLKIAIASVPNPDKLVDGYSSQEKKHKKIGFKRYFSLSNYRSKPTVVPSAQSQTPKLPTEPTTTFDAIKKTIGSDLELAIIALEKSSLIRRGEKGGQIWMHDLVQEVLLQNIEISARKELVFYATQIVAGAFPFADYDGKKMRTCANYLAHAVQVVEHSREYGLHTVAKALDAAFNIADYYHCIARFDESSRWYERILPDCEITYGKDHKKTLAVVANLADVKNNQFKTDEAAGLYERALAGYRKLYNDGENHPEILTFLFNMATNLIEQNKLDEATRICEQLLVAMEKVHGKYHRQYLYAVRSMGVILYQQGKLEEALVLLNEAADGLKTIYDEDDPNRYQYFNVLDDIALVFMDQDKNDEALPLLQQASDALANTLSRYHPSTLNITQHLARALEKLDRLDEALPMYEQVLVGYQKTLGPEHPRTRNTFRRLAAAKDKLSEST